MENGPKSTWRGLSSRAVASVRHFSEARKLSLAEDDAKDDTSISATFRKKAGELEAAHSNFEKYLSDEQKKCIANSPDTTEAMLALLDSANLDWCTRSNGGTGAAAAIKGRFHQVCKSLDQRDGLFSLFPKESEYVSVFYGAFNSIIAASVMHQAMAEGLPKIMDELNAIVSDVAKKIALYPEAKRQIRRVLIELHTRIFDLLAKIMNWYSKNNHLWKLMKKDCYNDFAQSLQEIRIWVEFVNKGAWNNLVLELRQTHDEDRRSKAEEREVQQRFQQDMLEAAGNFYEAQQNTAMQQAVLHERLVYMSSETYQEDFADLMLRRFAQHFVVIGANQSDVLGGTAESTPSSQRSIAADASDTRSLPDNGYGLATQSFLQAVGVDAPALTSRSHEQSSHTVEQRSREDIELASRVLDQWYPEGSMHPIRSGPASSGRPVLHESITARLAFWAKGAGSQVLCIELPYNHGQASVGSDIASFVVSSAWEANHPIISHFCSLRREVQTGRSPQTIALSEMVLSLMRQLVLLLPELLPEAACALNEARFSGLDGTLRTWDQMLGLFSDLLSLVTQSFLFVVHGLQSLDSAVTSPLITQLLATIRTKLDSLDESTSQSIKILFVTEGQARAVISWLRRGEHSVYEGPQRSVWRLSSA